MSRLKAISSGPLAEGTAEEIGPHLTLSPFRQKGAML